MASLKTLNRYFFKKFFRALVAFMLLLFLSSALFHFAMLEEEGFQESWHGFIQILSFMLLYASSFFVFMASTFCAYRFLHSGELVAMESLGYSRRSFILGLGALQLVASVFFTFLGDALLDRYPPDAETLRASVFYKEEGYMLFGKTVYGKRLASVDIVASDKPFRRIKTAWHSTDLGKRGGKWYLENVKRIDFSYDAKGDVKRVQKSTIASIPWFLERAPDFIVSLGVSPERFSTQDVYERMRFLRLHNLPYSAYVSEIAFRIFLPLFFVAMLLICVSLTIIYQRNAKYILYLVYSWIGCGTVFTVVTLGKSFLGVAHQEKMLFWVLGLLFIVAWRVMRWRRVL